MRADQLILERGLASSRSQAQRLIAAGVRWQPAMGDAAPWKAIGKNSDELPPDARIELLDLAEARYVSRGGLKLEGALDKSGLDVTGAACLDVGQSTGGFTDCLLQRGAAHVTGVDVGHGQLHANIRNDPRVTAVEGVNARAMTAQDLVPSGDEDDANDEPGPEAVTQAGFDVIVGDLSFISLTLVLPALVPLLRDGGHFLMLVKPQFELQPGQVGKGGIVKDPARHAEVEQRLRDCCASLALQVLDWFDSPINGGDGNREFFIYAKKQDIQS
ncbi:MAG: TlyA family RNA methyltransferase [Comamonadaceae bacterium]|nr:MAG: TlyA family RNA methyltransferase [Comamonadaceae bacterium]